MRPECADAVRGGELEFLLRGPARRKRSPGGGRGGIETLQLAGIPVVAKRPVHGGLFGRMMGGLYVGAGRLLVQARCAQRLRRGDVPTPEVLAIGWRRVFGPLQAHGIVTRAIPRGVTLYEAIRTSRPGMRRRAILRRCAELVRRMHDVGFLHADLNVTNLMLEEKEGEPRMQIIDLDRGRFENRVGPIGRTRNLARLMRSYEKWLAKESPLSTLEKLRFLKHYSGEERSLLRRLRAGLSLRRQRWPAALPRRLGPTRSTWQSAWTPAAA